MILPWYIHPDFSQKVSYIRAMKLQFFTYSLLCTMGLFAQQTAYIDFKTADASIRFGNLSHKELIGTIHYSFEILKDIDSVVIHARDFQMLKAQLDKHSKTAKYTGKLLIIKHPFKAGETHQITLDWKTQPRKGVYFIDWNTQKGNKQIWSQGQGKYTSSWLPSFDDVAEKVIFNLSITFDKNYTVIANGKCLGTKTTDALTTWHYGMRQPMSSYLLAFAIGKYRKNDIHSKSGIPIALYYYPNDSSKVEPTYRYTKDIFDFMERNLGKYPWQNYKQIPVKNFLYAGMENTSATIFSDAFVVDSIAFMDKNYVTVNAHELAHQWFGDLVTARTSKHHWLQEGFATYYALLAERYIFGDNHYYWQLYGYAQELLNQDQAQHSTTLLDPQASSITFYKKGAWFLCALREKVGDRVFKQAVRRYLRKNAFKTAQTDDFLKEVQALTKVDLRSFFDRWLTQKTFPYQEALAILKKSDFINEYLMTDCTSYTPKCNEYLNSDISEEAKIKIISQIPNHLTEADFQNSLKVRQAIAIYLTAIPRKLKTAYESLLKDASYRTIEQSLLNLWRRFPEDRGSYLEKTRNIQGFNDNNVRTLWLALAVITKDFDPAQKATYLQQLQAYTNQNYGFEIRQNAFQYLIAIDACKNLCQKNLEQATHHPVWQFSKFAKSMLQKTQNR